MPFRRGFCGCETWHGEKFELVPLTVLKLSLLIYQDMFMPWFYILVSINKHCDTWLVSECLPVEKLWLMTCSLKKWNIIGSCLRLQPSWNYFYTPCLDMQMNSKGHRQDETLRMCFDRRMMEFCWKNGRGLPCGPMYALSVSMCFWLG